LAAALISPSVLAASASVPESIFMVICVPGLGSPAMVVWPNGKKQNWSSG
jgi:hypothetical protein